MTTDTSLNASDNPIAGIKVENNATLTGADLIVTQSSNDRSVLIDDGTANLTGGSITADDDNSYALEVSGAGGNFTGNDVEIVTNGIRGYGVHAVDSGGATSTVRLTNGSITTNNPKGSDTQSGDGSRAYAIFAEGSGASVVTNGTTIRTIGQRAYGAYATNGSAVTLNKGSVTTGGFMAYGVYASGAGSTVTTNDVDITTTGYVGTAAWAYAGGRTTLNGGTLHVQGESNPTSPGESANGLMALGGTNGSGNGVIVAKNVTLITEGANSIGALAGGDVGVNETTGTIQLNNSTVRVRGANAEAARVIDGSTLTATNSSLISEQGTGIRMIDSATVTLNGTRVEAADVTFRSKFEQSGQSQTITVGNGSVATVNNGVLLQVNRDTAGQDGEVQLNLRNGSKTSGDIIDTDTKSGGGYTDVLVERNADWTGTTFGVRNFVTQSGSDVTFDEDFVINGNLSGNNTTYTFSQQGGTINGNVTLMNGSSTTGGSINNPVYVGGDVGVDGSSTLGGNWDISGNLSNSGTVTPGNSIGVVRVGGDLNLTRNSVYEVEVAENERAQNRRVDVIIVGGTANLAGTVDVSILDGAALNSPYTILTAGTLAGSRFDGVTWNSDRIFVNPTLSYTSSDVLLTFNRSNVSFASVAETRNQRATAGALDTLNINSPLAQTVAFLTASEAPQAFDSLSGEIHASVETTLLDDTRFVRNAALNRIHASFDETAAPAMPGMNYLAPESSSGLTAWGQGYGSWGSWDGNANTASLDRSIGGFVVGLDGAISPNTRVGILAGYADSSVDADALASTADIDTTSLGLYAGTDYRSINLSGGLAYSWYGIDTTRSIAIPGLSNALSADYDAHSFQVFGEAGYSIENAPANLEPFVGLAYVNLDSDSFSETGGPAALNGSGRSLDTGFTTLGLRASSETLIQTMPLTARGMIGWRSAFGDTDPSVVFAFTGGSSTFNVIGAPLSENTLVIEAGLDLEVSDMATASVSYSGQIGEDSDDHGIQGDLTFRF